MSAEPTTPPSLTELHDGYPSLAKWIAEDPDNETFIFRSFKQLSAQNILYLQSQVIALEEKLNTLDSEIRQKKDVNGKMDERQCLRRWETFVELSNAGNPTITERMKIVNEIQHKLKEYRECST